MLQNDLSFNAELGIEEYFTFDTNIYGKYFTFEIVKGGKEIVVNENNKKEYVKALAKFKLIDSIRP